MPLKSSGHAGRARQNRIKPCPCISNAYARDIFHRAPSVPPALHVSGGTVSYRVAGEIVFVCAWMGVVCLRLCVGWGMGMWIYARRCDAMYVRRYVCMYVHQVVQLSTAGD
jgi:hypothetical protein